MSLQQLAHYIKNLITSDDNDAHDYVVILVAELGDIIANAVNTILQNPHYLALEARWGSLNYLVTALAKQADSLVDIYDTGHDTFNAQLLSQLIFSSAYDMPGVEPYSLVISDFSLELTPAHLAWINTMAEIISFSQCMLLINLPQTINPASQELLLWQAELSGLRQKHVCVCLGGLLLRDEFYIQADTDTLPVCPAQYSIAINLVQHCTKQYMGYQQTKPEHVAHTFKCKHKNLLGRCYDIQRDYYDQTIANYWLRFNVVMLWGDALMQENFTVNLSNYHQVLFVLRLVHSFKQYYRKTIGTFTDEVQLVAKLNRWFSAWVSKTSPAFPLSMAEARIVGKTTLIDCVHIELLIATHGSQENQVVDLFFQKDTVKPGQTYVNR